MRIVLISGEFPPMQGGVGDYTREIAHAWTAQGHQVWVVVSQTLRDAYPSPQSLPWQVLPVVPAWTRACWSPIAAAIHQVQPDVVNVQYQAAAYDMRSPAINLLPWRIGRSRAMPPLVITFHDLQTPYLFPKAGPLRGWAVRLLARHSHAAIVTNAEDLNTARSWQFLASPPDRWHQIPIGSNIAVNPPPNFDREAWRRQRGYGPGSFVWAYFGFLNESKGGETLVRALALAPCDTHLLMIGGRVGSSDPTNQAYADRVEGLMRELGVIERVQWTGYVPPAEVSAALLSSDAMMLPYRDGISFRRGSLHAALAHGCAIVSTTPRIQLPELVDGENVLLTPPQNARSLEQAARRLQTDPTLRQRIGDGARRLAQQFTWEHIAQRTVSEVFEKLV